MTNAFENMDRMYRFQRYFYDLTRKYYLLGRDRLLNELDIRKDECVVEVGCGTGRNLIILARQNPEAHFYGLDASAAMLETAKAKIAAAGLPNVTLKTALADDFSFDKTFGLTVTFDKIFFSYSISMIPAWRKSLENALKNLKSGGELFIVDFYDMKYLPAWFQKLLQAWLKRFHVEHPQKLIPLLRNLEAQGMGKLEIITLYRRYSFIAAFRKNN
ncbi:class I SAM-dependent methyltransferase [soil metagenome]